MAQGAPPPPPPPPPPGGGAAREEGARILQHYAAAGAPPMQLQRLRRHLVAYHRRFGDLAPLEQKVFVQRLPPRALMDFIEQSLGGWPPAGAGGGGARPGLGRGGAASAPTQVVIKEIVKIPCRYCGTLVDVTMSKCPSCGAPPLQR